MILLSANIMMDLITSVGTFGAALAAILSARNAEKNTELSKQTLTRALENDKISSSPKLILEERTFKIILTDDLKGQKVHQFNFSTNEFSLFGNENAGDPIKIKLINVGKGYAKNIKVSWEIIDYDEIFRFISEKLNSIFYDSFIAFKFEGKYDEFLKLFYSLDGMSKDDLYLLHSKKPEEFYYLDSMGNYVYINLPSSWAVLLNYITISNYNIRTSGINYPKIKFTINYSDINEESYTDTYIYCIHNAFKSYPKNGEYKFQFQTKIQ